MKSSRPIRRDDPFDAQTTTTATTNTKRTNGLQDSVFLNARLPPAAERGTGGPGSGQGRLSPMKRALSPDNHSQRYPPEHRFTDRSQMDPSIHQTAARTDHPERSVRSYTTPTRSSFDTDGPRLHDLSSPDGVPYIPRDDSDLGASRRSTLEEEGAVGWPSPPRESASTDRLVARNGDAAAQGIPLSLVQALGFGSTGDDQAVYPTPRHERSWENDEVAYQHHHPAPSMPDHRAHQYPPDRGSDLGVTAAPRLYDLNRLSTRGRPFTNLEPGNTTPRNVYTSAPAYTSDTEPYRRKTSLRKYKRLEAQPLQSTTYFLGGRLLTGGDSILPLIGSFVLVLGLGGLWLGTTGVWMWRDGLGGGGAGAGGKAAVIIFAYLLGTCIGAMIATAFRDPGILPRNLDPTFPVSHTSSTGTLVPYTRDLRVKNGTVTVKYCETCKIYRPPRSSHCRLCGNCVEGIDHHCSYLHNCVGKRNYSSFISFLITAVLGLIYTIVFSAIHYRIITSRRNISFGAALRDSPGSAVSFAIGVVFVWPVMALLAYHLRLMFLNSTTIEQIRKSESRGLIPSGGAPPSNVFAYPSHLKNFFHSLCRAQTPSWVDADGWEVDDRRLINPGVIQAWEEERRAQSKGI